MGIRGTIVGLVIALSALAAQAADGASLVFVSNQDAATVSVIDTATDTVVGSIPVAFAPAGIAADRDGKTVYLTHPERGEISVIDAGRREVVR